jgi:hypothetical protein
MANSIIVTSIFLFFIITSLVASGLAVEHNEFTESEFGEGNVDFTNSSTLAGDSASWSIWDWIKTFFRMIIYDPGFSGSIANIVNLVIFFPLRIIFWWEAITIIKDLIPFT